MRRWACRDAILPADRLFGRREIHPVKALGAAGIATVPEPGRRIVAAALAGDGRCLPWEDPFGFAERALALALDDWHAAQALPGPRGSNRGILDAVAAYEHVTGSLPPQAEELRVRYTRQVLVAPPWRGIFAADPERRQGFGAARAEYHRLTAFLPRFGYQTLPQPRVPVAARVAFARRLLA